MIHIYCIVKGCGLEIEKNKTIKYTSFHIKLHSPLPQVTLFNFCWFCYKLFLSTIIQAFNWFCSKWQLDYEIVMNTNLNIKGEPNSQYQFIGRKVGENWPINKNTYIMNSHLKIKPNSEKKTHWEGEILHLFIALMMFFYVELEIGIQILELIKWGLCVSWYQINQNQISSFLLKMKLESHNIKLSHLINKTFPSDHMLQKTLIVLH